MSNSTFFILLSGIVVDLGSDNISCVDGRVLKLKLRLPKLSNKLQWILYQLFLLCLQSDGWVFVDEWVLKIE